MNELFSLNGLKVGQSAYVTELCAQTELGRRLTDLGLIPGTKVTCMAKSPAGDPAAYLIRGAVIALRSKDAADVRTLAPEQYAVPAHRAVTA